MAQRFEQFRTAITPEKLNLWLTGAIIGLLMMLARTDPAVIWLMGGRLLQTGAEEIIFRGLVLGWFVARGRVGLGVLVSTALFVMLHSLNADFGAGSAASLAAFSVAASLSVLRSGSVWWAWGLHFAWNLGLDLWMV